MQFPTVHLNGTDYKTLYNEYMNAYDRVDDALQALREVTVHGRDYYVQDGNAFEQARREHIERLEKLESVKRDLEKIIINLNDQVTK